MSYEAGQLFAKLIVLGVVAGVVEPTEAPWRASARRRPSHPEMPRPSADLMGGYRVRREVYPAGRAKRAAR